MCSTHVCSSRANVPRRRRTAAHRSARALACLLPTLIFTLPATAQPPTARVHSVINPCLVTGLVEDALRQPVSGARLRIVGTLDSSLTDASGSFRLISCGAKRRLAVKRLGFVPDTSAVADTARRHAVTLRALPVALSATTVKVRPGGIGLLSSGFHERRDRGFGTFLGPEQLAQRFASNITQLLRGMPGVTVDSRPGTQMRVTVRQCGNPTIWMDGVRMRGGYALEVIDPQNIDGIEVYRGFSELPSQFHDPSGCGAVVFWSKTAVPR